MNETTIQPLHTRRIEINGGLRSDDRWVIAAHLVDTKPYDYEDRERGILKPGHPLHDISVTLVLDREMRVTEVSASFEHAPFSYCDGSKASLDGLIGCGIGTGWRKAVDTNLRGHRGCSHIRELLYGMATVAFQTVSSYQEQFTDLGPPKARDGIPFFLDQCHSFMRSGPIVERYIPEFYKKDDKE